MARWMLVCPHCSHRFEHSKVDPAIVAEALRDPFKIVPKPKFTNGEARKCPGCSKESLYRAYELIYYGDETALGAAGGLVLNLKSMYQFVGDGKKSILTARIIDPLLEINIDSAYAA